jgi:hypothetical protein
MARTQLHQLLTVAGNTAAHKVITGYDVKPLPASRSYLISLLLFATTAPIAQLASLN